MTLPGIVSRDEWLAARRELLLREKEHTRAADALNTARRMLPMVRVEKAYVFDGPEGEVGLADLFAGHRQLVLQHFMFDPQWTDGCSSCTAAVDELSDGLLAHLRARETNYAIVARAPLAKVEAYRAKRGWSIPIYSSYRSDFNYDFHVTLDASVRPVEFNYRGADELGADICHTYSTFARGMEQTGGAYAVLDMTALGRQEDWEEPKGRAGSTRGPVPDFS
ncbi:MAG TPA: DUF899 domain-containing protein [Rugosimonospora sp.]|nr:DUF899 domain-containing protein [Rugosimonospora sp.]